MIRSAFKTLDHVRGQGAGRFERTAAIFGGEHFEGPETPPPGVRRTYEATSKGGMDMKLAQELSRLGARDMELCMQCADAVRPARCPAAPIPFPEKSTAICNSA